jgi:hypothetical protein
LATDFLKLWRKNNMTVELYCTYDEDRNEWLVWFPHPLGGMNVLDSFDNETDARRFWQEQIDSADFG